MNTPIALVIGFGLLAAAIFLASPHYQMYPITSSTNPAAWRVNQLTGDVSLCASAAGEGTEAGCTAKLKQF